MFSFFCLPLRVIACFPCGFFFAAHEFPFNIFALFSLQAHPMNAATALTQRAVLIDDIWHAAGDRSTDMDWYAKRAVLGGVYTATELYLLTDYSPGMV
jgi:rpsU-divergently transcribed protein